MSKTNVRVERGGSETIVAIDGPVSVVATVPDGLDEHELDDVVADLRSELEHSRRVYAADGGNR